MSVPSQGKKSVPKDFEWTLAEKTFWYKGQPLLPTEVRNQHDQPTCIFNAMASAADIQWRRFKFYREETTDIIFNADSFALEYARELMVPILYDRSNRTLGALEMFTRRGVFANSAILFKEPHLIKLAGYQSYPPQPDPRTGKLQKALKFDHVRVHINSGRPILGVIDVRQSFSKLKRDEIYKVELVSTPEDPKMTHMVLFVGYGWRNRIPYLVFLNSHGVTFGKEGYGLVWFDGVHQSSSELCFHTVTFDKSELAGSSLAAPSAPAVSLTKPPASGSIGPLPRQQDSLAGIARRPHDADTKSDAKEEAVAAIIEFVKSSDLYQCDLFNLPAVAELEKDEKYQPFYELLKIFLTQRLESYLEFQTANSTLLKDYGLVHDECITKMRLMSLLDLSSHCSRQIPYSAITNALVINDDEVEYWVARAISCKILDCKIDQLNEIVIVSQHTERILGGPQSLQSELEVWREDIANTINTIQAHELAEAGGQRMPQLRRLRSKLEAWRGTIANAMKRFPS